MKKKDIFIIILLVLLDLSTKYYFTYNKVIVIKDILEFNYLENFGASFNILTGSRLILIIIGIIGLIYVNKTFKNNILLNAGIIGNLFDRIIYGYVRDYISILSFPVFNLADTYIVLGAILIVIKLIEGKNDK
jgi:signal peptidase II